MIWTVAAGQETLQRGRVVIAVSKAAYAIEADWDRSSVDFFCDQTACFTPSLHFFTLFVKQFHCCLAGSARKVSLYGSHIISDFADLKREKKREEKRCAPIPGCTATLTRLNRRCFGISYSDTMPLCRGKNGPPDGGLFFLLYFCESQQENRKAHCISSSRYKTLKNQYNVQFCNFVFL